MRTTNIAANERNKPSRGELGGIYSTNIRESQRPSPQKYELVLFLRTQGNEGYISNLKHMATFPYQILAGRLLLAGSKQLGREWDGIGGLRYKETQI